MNARKRKFLSAVLVIVMALSLSGTLAMAAEPGG